MHRAPNKIKRMRSQRNLYKSEGFTEERKMPMLRSTVIRIRSTDFVVMLALLDPEEEKEWNGVGHMAGWTHIRREHTADTQQSLVNDVRDGLVSVILDVKWFANILMVNLLVYCRPTDPHVLQQDCSLQPCHCWHTATSMISSAPEPACTSLRYGILHSAALYPVTHISTHLF
jgi:hypothetical protein